MLLIGCLLQGILPSIVMRKPKILYPAAMALVALDNPEKK